MDEYNQEGAELGGQVLNGGADIARRGASGAQRATQTKKKIKKKAKKDAKKGAKKTAKIVGGASAGTGGVLIPLVAIILVIAILLMMLASVGDTQEDEELSSEAQIVWEYIELTVNNSMVHSDFNSDEVSHYRSILNQIKNNGYRAEACALFKMIIYDNLCRYLEFVNYDTPDGNSWESQTTTYQEYIYSLFTRYFIEPSSPDGYYIYNSQDTPFYDNNGVIDWTSFFSNWKSSINSSNRNWDSHIEWQTHIYFLQSVVAAVLDSFIDEETGEVFEKAKDELGETESDRQAQIYSRFASNVTNRNTKDKYKVTAVTVSAEGDLSGILLYAVFGKIVPVRDEDGNATDQTMWEPTYITGSINDSVYISFVSYTAIFKAQSGAGDIVTLALRQVGNGGGTYCDEMNNGVMTDWCAIFCGWLMRSCGYNEDAYGYSPSVPTWAGTAQSYGIWHEASGGYTPKASDFIVFGYDGNLYSHIGIVVSVNSSTVSTVEGNTGTYNYNSSIVQQYSYGITNSVITGYIETNFPVTSGDGSTSLNGVGSYTVDPSYRPQPYSLTSTQRTYLEHVVTGEFGNDYIGSCLIAQCLRDAFVNGLCRDPMKVRESSSQGGLGYVGWSDGISQNAVNAINYIFSGNSVIQHRIFYMCTEDIYCPGDKHWHYNASHGSNATITRIIQRQNVIFFDRNY